MTTRRSSVAKELQAAIFDDDSDDFIMEDNACVANQRDAFSESDQSISYQSPSESNISSVVTILSTSGTLLHQLLAPRANVGSVVSAWLRSYKADGGSACCALKNMVVEACGSRIIPAELWSSDLTEIFEEMKQSTPPGPYPLINRQLRYKKLRTVLGAFLTNLIDNAKYSVVYDDKMLSEITTFIWRLADSDVRAFRHTATFCAMKLMVALIQLMHKVQESMNSAERLLDAERNRDKPNNEKFKALSQNYKSLKAQWEYLKGYVLESKNVVLVHRCRDICWSIRILCIEELGICMLTYPEFCLDDSFLKFIFFNLHDSEFESRLACLKVLDALYERSDFKPKLELFSDGCKKRLLNMIDTPEEEIRMLTIRILNKMDSIFPGMLYCNEIRALFEMTLSNSSGVCWEAGKFMHRKCYAEAVDPNTLEELDLMAGLNLNESLSDPASDHSNRSVRHPTITERMLSTNPNAKCLRRLGAFIDESGLIGESIYLVDSLWDTSPMLQDWGTMIKLLLVEPDEEMESDFLAPTCTSSSASLALFDIVVSAANLATNGKAPPRRERPRKAKTPRDTALQREKRRLSEVLIPAFPLLLDRYVGDAEKLAYLLKLPECFDMTVYTTSRLENTMSANVRCLAEIFKRHVNAEVLSGASKTFQLFCNEAYSVATRCVTSFGTLVASIMDSFVTTLKELQRNEWTYEPATSDFYHLLSSCIRKLAALFTHNDLNKWRLSKPALALLRLATERRLTANMPEIIESAAKCGYMSIMWMTRSFVSKVEEDVELTGNITFMQEKLVNYLAGILEIDEYGRSFDVVYACLCDVLVLFSPRVSQKAQKMTVLTFLPNPRVQDIVVKFVGDMLKKWTSPLPDNNSVSESPHASFSDRSNASSISDRDKWKSLQLKRSQVAIFGQLIAYRQLEARYVAPLVRNFAAGSNDFGDLLKVILAKSREISEEETAKAIHSGLLSVYLACMRNCHQNYSKDAVEMEPVRRLARMLSQSFGVDLKRVRKCIVALHKAGIEFAFRQAASGTGNNDLAYLDVLQFFLPKLLLEDRRQVAAEFTKQAGTVHGTEDVLEIVRHYERGLGLSKDIVSMPPPPPSASPSSSSVSASPRPVLAASRLWSPQVETIRAVTRRSQRAVSLGGASDWTTPGLTSTALRKGKGKRIVLDDDEDDEQEQENVNRLPSNPWSIGGVHKSSPAKRSRSVSSWEPLGSRPQICVPSPRPSATSSETGSRDDSVEGFEPLSPVEDDENCFEPGPEESTTASSSNASESGNDPVTDDEEENIEAEESDQSDRSDSGHSADESGSDTLEAASDQSTVGDDDEEESKTIGDDLMISQSSSSGQEEQNNEENAMQVDGDESFTEQIEEAASDEASSSNDSQDCDMIDNFSSSDF